MVALEDPLSPGGTSGELDGRLHRLRPGVGEEDSLDAGVGPVDQLLGQQTGEQSAVQLDQVGEVGLDGLSESVLDHRMAAAEGEHTESGEEVEVPVALVVDQVPV